MDQRNIRSEVVSPPQSWSASFAFQAGDEGVITHIPFQSHVGDWTWFPHWIVMIFLVKKMDVPRIPRIWLPPQTNHIGHRQDIWISAELLTGWGYGLGWLHPALFLSAGKFWWPDNWSLCVVKQKVSKKKLDWKRPEKAAETPPSVAKNNLFTEKGIWLRDKQFRNGIKYACVLQIPAHKPQGWHF